MKKLLLVIFLTLGYCGFAQVKSDTEMKTYNNTYISPGIVGGVRAVNHNMLNRYILDSKIHKDSLELNRNSDVNLTTPDSYDLLIMDEESMRWVNISLEDFSQLLSDSTVQMWYRSYDTAKTIYHVLVDSSFLMRYNGTLLGYDPFGSGEKSIAAAVQDGDTVTMLYSGQNTGTWSSGMLTINSANSGEAHIFVRYEPEYEYYYSQMAATLIDSTSSITVYPRLILLESDTTRITGQIFAPDIEPEAGAKFYQIVGYGLDGRLFPRTIIDWYDAVQDSIAKEPTVYSTWVRDTTNGYLYPATLTDKVGIGTASPSVELDIVGAIKASENFDYSNADNNIVVGEITAPIVAGTRYLSAFGWKAGNESKGLYNTFMGMVAGDSVIGNSNTGMGSYALYESVGAEMVAVGYQAGRSSINSSWGTFVGANSGLDQNGLSNVFYGYNSGWHNDGNSNTGIGNGACESSHGDKNTFIGFNSGYYGWHDDAIGLGYSSMQGDSSNRTIGIGHYAGQSNRGDSSIFIGSFAGFENIGNDCIFLGYQAGMSNSDSGRFELKQNHINSTPLMYGYFNSGDVFIDQLIIPDTSYFPSKSGAFMTSDGTNFKIENTPATGDISIIGYTASVGVQAFHFDGGTGRIGIGTSSPSNTIDLGSDVDINGDLDMTSGDIDAADTVTANMYMGGIGINNYYASWSKDTNTFVTPFPTTAVTTTASKALYLKGAAPFDYSYSNGITAPSDSVITFPTAGRYEITFNWTASSSVGINAKVFIDKNDGTILSSQIIRANTSASAFSYSINTIANISANDYIELKYISLLSNQTITQWSMNINITRIQ